MSNIEQKLLEYGNSLGLPNLTIDQLIKSHKHLRELNAVRSAEQTRQFEENIATARKQAYEAVTHGEYISMSVLSTLTLSEIFDLMSK